jgi:hypothetical protein
VSVWTARLDAMPRLSLVVTPPAPAVPDVVADCVDAQRAAASHTAARWRTWDRPLVGNCRTSAPWHTRWTQQSPIGRIGESLAEGIKPDDFKPNCDRLCK